MALPDTLPPEQRIIAGHEDQVHFRNIAGARGVRVWDKLLLSKAYSDKGEVSVRVLLHMRSNISVVLGLVSLIAIAVDMNAPQVHAQGTSASVSGRVTDQSGGVVVDAEVEVKDVDRGVATIVKTNGEGFYSLPSLIPGNYLMSVRKQGFQTVSVTGITLNIQDNLSRNFVLQVGSSAVSITVNANDIHLNTTNASVSTVVDQTYIKNMPLNGRSFQDLILLTPGVTTQTPQVSQVSRSSGQRGEFSVNGQRTDSNYYTVDGVSANVGAIAGDGMTTGSGASGSVAGSTALGTTQALVSVDALQEFRVQGSTYSAEYGRNPGGQFAFETKSGTNQWHGTAYDYVRNNYFDANDWFNGYFGKPAAALRQNDFGGTLGAPIRVPGLYNGKDKTFFFVSYEGLRLAAPQPATAIFVPDTALRSTAPPALQAVLNAFPVQSPNGIDDTAHGVAQFIGTWSNPSSIDSTSVRFDHVLNDKVRLFFRFSDTGSSSTARATTPSTPTMKQPSVYTLRTYTAGVSTAFSSRLSNEFRLNYTSNVTTNSTVIDSFGRGVPVDLGQLTGLGPDSWIFFVFISAGHPMFLQQPHSSGAQKQWNLVDTMNFTVGRQQLKFGTDYRRLSPFATNPTRRAPYVYTSVAAVTANRALLTPTASAPAYPLYKNLSAFAQDEWRASQRLSVSLGLRWEVNPAPGATKGLKPYTVQGPSPDTWTLAPQGTPLWQTTWFNFAPRLGVAYILSNGLGRETVVRAGGGVFFDTGQQLGSEGFIVGPGFSASGPTRTISFPGNPAALIPPIVNPPVPPFGSVNVFGYAPHLQLPYTLQWNASIEQAVGKSQALTVSYVGSHATRLLQRDFFQPSNPNMTFVYFVENRLTSDYDAMQVQFRRRLSRGLTALGSYTWSHCLDYGSQNLVYGYQRGNCDFDVRHNLSAAFSYDLPNIGHNRFVAPVLHHWGLDDRFIARSAFPITLHGNENFDPVTGLVMDSGLNLVSNQPIYLYGTNCTLVLEALGDLAPGNGCPGGRAINPQAFTSVASGLGNAPRNFARGFGAWQMNLAVRRDFPLGERLKLQFRAEAFNIFNHPNFGTVNSLFGQKTFGQATATLANSLGVLNPLYQTGGPRSAQFALKLVF